MFEKNIFINCPFDNEYFPILTSIFFTIIFLDYIPKISETTDSGATRLLKIQDLIAKSKYSIHDISRVELNSNNLPRFNMPLECGIDFGAKMLGSKKLKTKSFLILEKEKYRYQEFMSDISGNDIRSHKNDPELAIKHVRDWIKLNSNSKVALSREIWLVFNEFMVDYIVYANENNFDPHQIDSITFSDLIESMTEWIVVWKETNKK